MAGKRPKQDTSGGRDGSRFRGFLLQQLLGTALSPITGFAAAIPLAFGCLFLVIGWTVGPQRVIDAKKLAGFTAHADGRIVESWLALDFDPATMGKYRLWRPQAHAAQCVVVEYDTGWGDARGGPIRRAFCGLRLQYNDAFTLADFRTLTKGVPFAWARDPNGFAVPEMRLSSTARDWLASHPDPDPLPLDPPTRSALESLRVEQDRPVDLAVLGWTTPAPAIIPLLFDPRDPRGALPAGQVAEQLDLPPTGLLYGLFVFCLIPGTIAWLEGMAFLLGGMPRWAFWFVALVPIAAVPWWGARMPHFIGGMNAKMGDIVSMMLEDVSLQSSAKASAPADALLAHGERLTWHLSEGAYADTLGRLRFTPPNPPPESPAEAERLLTATVTEQVRALAPGEQTAMFQKLRAQKDGKLTGAGQVFLPAARDAALAADSPPELQRAATALLGSWGHYFAPYAELTPDAKR